MYSIQSDNDDYINVSFYVRANSGFNLRDCAWAIAIGQSVGNPNVRNSWESDELFANHACMIWHLEEELSCADKGEIKIGFPLRNLDFSNDGVAQLLCFILGGHFDIDCFASCRVIDIAFPKSFEKHLHNPAFGISGLRRLTGSYDRPFLGAIVKPKTGLSVEQLGDVVWQLMDGGADFIKEDEILGNPKICELAPRVERIAEIRERGNYKSIICHCINGDPVNVVDKAKTVASAGGNGVHINLWSGLGSYKSIRELNLPLFIHLQKSGDKAFTNPKHDFGIDWLPLLKILTFTGIDSAHVGMWGGYLSDPEHLLQEIFDLLIERNVIGSLSCGMHPGLVNKITEKFGNDLMLASGGAIHGHPSGSRAGTRAMRQGINKEGGQEFDEAIKFFG